MQSFSAIESSALFCMHVGSSLAVRKRSSLRRRRHRLEQRSGLSSEGVVDGGNFEDVGPDITQRMQKMIASGLKRIVDRLASEWLQIGSSVRVLFGDQQAQLVPMEDQIPVQLVFVFPFCTDVGRAIAHQNDLLPLHLRVAP